MRRRDFIKVIAGVGATPARGCATENAARIGALMVLPAEDPETQTRLTAFALGLQQLGCSAEQLNTAAATTRS